MPFLMPFLPFRLRHAAIAAAMLTSAFAPPATGFTAAAAMTGLTAATLLTASEADARERVRDHRKRRCPPHAAGPGCVPR